MFRFAPAALAARVLRGSNRSAPCHLGRSAFSSSPPSSDDLVAVTLDSASKIATLSMQNAPVNSLSLEMCQALTSSIEQAEQDPKIQALVLQSSNPTIFSAGLDLTEMHNPDLDRLKAFWESFQNLYFSLYGSRLATIAAIQGHAPAAGCMLCLSCDYRIMAASPGGDGADPKKAATIGLNESKFGIVAPPWLAQQMVDTVGRRRAELSLSLGTLYTAEQALEIGLIDVVVPKDAVQGKAVEEAAQWAAMVPQARVASKQLIRKRRIEALRSKQQDDIDYFVDFITQEKVQKNLGIYLEMLLKKRST